MATVAGFPYFRVEFDKNANRAPSTAGEVTALEQHLAAGDTTDLLVLAHGWNNNMQEAEELYAELLGNMRTLLDQERVPGLAGRAVAVLAVLWPSKKFEDSELIPSGAAGVAGAVKTEQLRAQIDRLKGGFDAADADTRLETMKTLLPRLEESDAACRQFVEQARGLMARSSASDPLDTAEQFFSAPPTAVFEAMALPVSFVSGVPSTVERGAGGGLGMPGGGAGGGEMGNAAGLGDFFSGALSSARNILNYSTYYQMKERAGLIGARGVNPLLRTLAARHPELRLHLVGHSFGGRLVAATVAGSDDSTLLTVSSLALLQAAFSHYGFSGNWDDNSGKGFFRRVIDKQAVTGPTIITCTEMDKAVGVAYPIASLLANQVASGLGDKHSKWGGIGSNGAQKSDAVDATLLDVGDSYALSKGKLHNLEAGSLITGHGDVRNPRVAYAVLSAMAGA